MVDAVEREGRGLNLCYETRIGILAHTNPYPEESREAAVVRLCDHVAFLNHDLDDAMRAGIIEAAQVPDLITRKLGERNSQRIDYFIRDIIEYSRGGTVGISPDLQEVWDAFHDFMFANVYRNPRAKSEESKVENILRSIWDHYRAHPEALPADYRTIAERDGLERAVTDYVSGMTDDYAIEKYGEIFIPMAWSVK